MSEAQAERRSVDIVNTEQHIKLRANYTRVKQELAAAQTKLIDAEKERDAARGEVATVKSKYDENKLSAENAELKGQLRTLNHRRTFDRLADERKVPADARDLLWQASGWKAEKDEPDEAAMAALLDDLKARPGVARLFGEAETQTPTPTPAPGRGQGARDATNGKFRVTSAQMRDPAWCMANRERRDQAAKDGTLEIVD